METEPRTEQPSEAPTNIVGEASDPPMLFLVVMWVPVFAVVAWGMMLLMGRRPWEFNDNDPGGEG